MHGCVLVQASDAESPFRIFQAVRAAAVCSAEGMKEAAGKAAATLALAAVVTMAAPAEVFAKDVEPYAGLTPCKGNAAFAKRQKQELKVIEKRLKQVQICRSFMPPYKAVSEQQTSFQPAAACLPLRAALDRAPMRRCFSLYIRLSFPQYEAGSAPALALKATAEKTKQRFENYADQGLLCGKDGLPHLIVDGNLQHLGEFTVSARQISNMLVLLFALVWLDTDARPIHLCVE